MENAALSEKNLQEIFRAFIQTADHPPSAGLLHGLAQASGKSEDALRAAYRAYAQSLTGEDHDPFAV